MVAFILNAPYTLIGLLMGLLSLPKAVTLRTRPYALIFEVKKLWWLFGYLKGARAMTIGHIILLGSSVEEHDLQHELIHVAQYARTPLIHPILYYIEFVRNGYKKNKYEEEAYRLAGNIYKMR